MGSPETTKSISVDGQDFPVMANLREALERLRDPVLERVIWIDAIYINQGDTEEKSRQVQVMSMVYAKAIRVVVWLGNLGKHGQALELVCQYASGDVANGAQTPEEDQLEAFEMLLSASWFQRVWAGNPPLVSDSEIQPGYFVCIV